MTTYLRGMKGNVLFCVLTCALLVTIGRAEDVVWDTKVPDGNPETEVAKSCTDKTGKEGNGAPTCNHEVGYGNSTKIGAVLGTTAKCAQVVEVHKWGLCEGCDLKKEGPQCKKSYRKCLTCEFKTEANSPTEASVGCEKGDWIYDKNLKRNARRSLYVGGACELAVRPQEDVREPCEEISHISSGTPSN